MAVDIIIPAHNTGRFLGATLESLRAQSMPRWQAYVVDDASTDDTREVAAAAAALDPRIHVIESQENIGAAAARDLAFAQSDAPFVAFLDSDDIWEPYTLEVLLDALEGDPEAPAAHGFGRNIDTDGHWLTGAHGSDIIGLERPVIRAGRRRVLPTNEPTPFEAFAVSCPIPTPGLVLLRRAALEALERPIWDPRAFPADDWLLWLRITQGGESFAFVPRPVLRYRRHPAQATTRANPHLGPADAYVRQWVLQHGERADRERLVREGWRYEWWRTAQLRGRWAVEQAMRGQLVGALRQARHASIAIGRSTRWSRWHPVI